MRLWTRRQWLVAISGSVVAALAIGTPTAIIDTPFFSRMTPVLWWNYPVWIITALFTGLILATYVASGTAAGQTFEGKKTAVGSVMSLLAVGCPICNKLVVLALGVSGASSYFAPIQPLLAVASVALLGYALRRRLQALKACPMPPRPAVPRESAAAGPPLQSDPSTTP